MRSCRDLSYGRTVPSVTAVILGAAIFCGAINSSIAQGIPEGSLECYKAASTGVGKFENPCRKAAQAGDGHAMFLLAMRSDPGPTRIDWLTKAVSRGNLQAAMVLSSIRRSQGDTERANKLIQFAAENGYGPARIQIAKALRANSKNSENVARARSMFTNEAIAGYPEAQYQLAWMLYNGEGGPKDQKGGIEWLFEAASAGYVPAQYDYAVANANQPKEAVRWFTKAARAGSPTAMYQLALLHGNGKGIPVNLQTAAYWATRATRAGQPDAPALLPQIAAAMQANANAGGGGNAAKPASPNATASAASVPSKPAAPATSPPANVPYNLATVQRELAALGYRPGPADGQMGTRTRTAIEQFQNDNRLPVTGVPGPQLLSQILSVKQTKGR